MSGEVDAGIALQNERPTFTGRPPNSTTELRPPARKRCLCQSQALLPERRQRQLGSKLGVCHSMSIASPVSSRLSSSGRALRSFALPAARFDRMSEGRSSVAI
jgi:hypothetical protein